MIGRAKVLPRIGGMLASLLGTVAMYRHQRTILLLACLMSVVSHSLFTITLFVIAVGLPGDHPTLAQHFIIIPMGMAAGGLPLPLGTLGATEYVIDHLYRTICGSSQGLVVALGYRLITVVIAMVGACFYLTSRREVAAVMHEAESTPQETTADDSPPPEHEMALNSPGPI